MSADNDYWSEFYECAFILSPWGLGTDLLGDLIATIRVHTQTLEQLHQWKRRGFLFAKPSLSTPNIFVFWIHESKVNEALILPGVRRGFCVPYNPESFPESSRSKDLKQSSSSPRVLLDIGCDSPKIIQQLTWLGLEVELVWNYLADLIHHELIELCTSQSFDLLVTPNERLLTPPEEWLNYLMPRRTQLFIPPQGLAQSPKKLAQAIFHRATAQHSQKTSSSKQELIR